MTHQQFATYGACDDDMYADDDTIRQYIGKSSLGIVDTILVQWVYRIQWVSDQFGRDAFFIGGFNGTID